MAADPQIVDRRVIPSVLTQLQAEGRWLTFARLVIAATCLSWFGLLVWALPALAGATAVSDPSSAIVLAVVFCLAAGGSSGAAFAVWRPLLRGEPRSEFLRIVRGGRKLIRNRTQFEGRLEHECQRAGDDAQAFLVVAVRALADASDARGPRALGTHPGLAALLVRSAAREDDVVAVEPPASVWLLARGDADALRHSVVPRLARVLQEVEGAVAYQVGVAEFGVNGSTPAELFAAARAELRDVAEDSRFAA